MSRSLGSQRVRARPRSEIGSIQIPTCRFGDVLDTMLYIALMSSQLAQKERKLFSELLQAYEQKQLSKGRKIADQILKKYPQHGGMFFDPRCLACLTAHRNDVHEGPRHGPPWRA